MNATLDDLFYQVMVLGVLSSAGLGCGSQSSTARETDPTGSTGSLYQGRWPIYISACVIPLT